MEEITGDTVSKLQLLWHLLWVAHALILNYRDSLQKLTIIY